MALGKTKVANIAIIKIWVMIFFKAASSGYC